MPTYRLVPDPSAGRGDIVAGDPAMRQRDRILLGKLAESGPRRHLWLDISGEQVVSIVGKRGTGKSYTLGVMIEGLAAGEGETAISQLTTPRAALILDIMDIFWTSRLPLVKDGPDEMRKQFAAMTKGGMKTQSLGVDLWIPAGFENAEVDPPDLHPLRIRASDLTLDDWGSLFEVDIYGEPRGMLIADAISHVSDKGYTALDGSTVPARVEYGLEHVVACLENDIGLRNDYQDATIRSIRQRMGTYAALPLFCSDQGTPLTDLLKPFRSSVLMLGRATDALKRVLVAVLVKRIMRERRDASFAQKRLDLDSSLSEADRASLAGLIAGSIPRTWVLMDEAHILAGSSESSVAREAMIRYAKEGRNYGLSLAIATQQPGAIDSRLTSQVETIVSHQLTSPEDAAVASRAMRSPEAQQILVDNESTNMSGLLRRLTQGEAVFSSGNAPDMLRSCVARIRPRITAHGGYEA